jgi:iron-sulfur cluster assembly protein
MLLVQLTAPLRLLLLLLLCVHNSDALIGGGFQFNNPNAADSCGCGKSFGV